MWGIDFMVPLVSYDGMKYIIVAIEYVPNLVESIVLANNKVKSVTTFLKKIIFSRFSTPRQLLMMGDPTFEKIFSKGG